MNNTPVPLRTVAAARRWRVGVGGRLIWLLGQTLAALAGTGPGVAQQPLALHYEPGWLSINGESIPGGEIRIHYLEAYCRGGSTDADWVQHTVLPHQTEVLGTATDSRCVRLRDTLADGVTIEHTITAGTDEVDFRLTAHNPTPRRSEAEWAQPCVRLARFTGFADHGDGGGDLSDYLPRCFVFLDGQLERMPTRGWATTARYTPGQVWCPRHVPRSDVNPRPLNPLVPSHGLIGAYSGDEQWIFATAWEPYQELFQGVARCLHSDIRLGGLPAGETREIRGKIYLVPADIPALLERYERDFPEHRGNR